VGLDHIHKLLVSPSISNTSLFSDVNGLETPSSSVNVSKEVSSHYHQPNHSSDNNNLVVIKTFDAETYKINQKSPSSRLNHSIN
jgi:hypothetical protein